MEIVAALFVETFDMRQADGGAARLDLGGVYFSTVPSGSYPLEIDPHLVVLVRCPPGEDGFGALETLFMRGDEQIARNVQPITVEPGKFSYQLVRGELHFDGPGTVEAQCRINDGPVTTVPLTLLEEAS